MTPFKKGLETKSDESQAGQKRRESEGRDRIVLIVQDLHL
jgi:hypothetical protein